MTASRLIYGRLNIQRLFTDGFFTIKMISLIVVLVSITVSVCGKSFSVPFKNPMSCPSVTVGGQKYNSFFNSLTMNCTPCSQTEAFQERSDDGHAAFCGV